MKQSARTLIMALSLAIIGVAGHSLEATADPGYPCMACWYDCLDTPDANRQCREECNGMEAQYCVGPDQWEFCADKPPGMDMVIQCGNPT